MKQLSKEELRAIADKKTALIAEFIKAKRDPRASYLKMVPKACKFLFYRVYTAPKSKADAIKAKCLDCSCFVRTEVTACEMITCPLWQVRPYQEKK